MRRARPSPHFDSYKNRRKRMIKSELPARDRDRQGTPPALPRIAQAHSDEEAREIIVASRQRIGS